MVAGLVVLESFTSWLPKPPRICFGEQHWVDKRVDKMTSKVYSIFSVYNFVIICCSLKCSCYSYSLGPETYEIIVSKIHRNEAFLGKPSIPGHPFPLKTSCKDMNRIKETRKTLECIVLKASIVILVCIYSFKIFDPMGKFPSRLYVNMNPVF